VVETGTVHSGRDGERPVPLRKPKESGTGRRDVKKICLPSRITGMLYIFVMTGASGQGTWAKQSVALASESDGSLP